MNVSEKDRSMEETGFFSDDRTVYTITNMFPPRPWRNYLWNEEFIACIDQFGFGGSRHVSGEGVRAGCVGGPDSRLIYIRDHADGAVWAANRNYLREPFEDFRCEVGIGFSRIRSAYRQVEAALHLFVPAGGNLECWTVEVANASPRPRELSLFVFADSDVNAWRMGPMKRGTFEPELGGLWLAHHGNSDPTPLTNMFFCCDTPCNTYETTLRRFRGVWGLMSAPDAVAAGRLASKGTSFDPQMCAAMQFDLKLQPDERRNLRFIAGLAGSLRDAVALRGPALSADFFDRQLAAVAERAATQRRKVQVLTGDLEVDALANVWFKRQVDLGKTWGRVSSPRFRDIMQDIASFAPMDPGTARAKILYCLEHQYEDGNTQRQWHPSDPHPFRDGPSWIPATLNAYLKETNDLEFLEECVPFVGGAARGSVLEHARRGMRFLFDGLGPHGLCLWGGGDWNDSLDTAGLAGRGESVWLSLAAVAASGEFAELLERLDQAAEIRRRAETLAQAVRRHAWDGDHFICGYDDLGRKVGSHENREGRIFLNMQTWAVLAGVADHPQALMDLVERELACPWGYVLNKPSYTRGDPHIGRATYFEKGSYENGSVYNHGVAFKIAADCALGRGRLAWATLKKILPGNPSNPASRSGCEPYAITNMYLGPDNDFRPGDSINSWTTGAAGWLLRCVTQHILGVRADWDGLLVRPCLPPHCCRAAIRREFRGATYEIEILNPHGRETGPLAVWLNGNILPGNLIPQQPSGTTNTARVELGKNPR